MRTNKQVIEQRKNLFFIFSGSETQIFKVKLATRKSNANNEIIFCFYPKQGPFTTENTRQ